jgi:hypothetical protein
MKNNNLKQFLIRFFLLLAILLPSGAAYSSEADILREIKNLRDDMNKRFEQVDKRFEQVDKRFESMQSQMDKRFEQVDKRFDQLLWFIGLWIPLSMAVVGYILQRLNKHDDRFFEISKKSIEAEDIITAINKAKPETRKRLKEALKG